MGGARCVRERERTYISFDSLMEMLDGLEFERSVNSVDSIDELRDLGGDRRRVSRRRGSDLNQDDLSSPLWIIM